MDYVLFGMGYGATLMLLGWALRTFGPERKYRNIDPEDIDRTVEQYRWVRFIQGLGGVLAISGTSMVLFTFVTMLVNPDDETGSFTALVIWGFLVVSILVWCWFYVATYGLLGIWSRRDGYGFRGTTTPITISDVQPEISRTRLVDDDATEDVGNGSQDEEISADPPTAEDAPSKDPDQSNLPGDSAEGVELQEEDESESEDDATPEYDFGDSSDTTVPSEIGGRTEAVRRLRERPTRQSSTTE